MSGWTEAEDLTLTKCAAQGMTSTTVALRLGRSRSVIAKRAVALNVVFGGEKFVWSPENEAECKKRWLGGESSQVIANALGTTRHSIIGRMYRLGIPSPKGATSRRLDSRVQHRGPSKPNGAQALAKAPLVRQPTPPRPIVITSRSAPVPLVKLKFGICRFPVNSPEVGYGETTLFCGAAVRDVPCPYCADHARIAFLPPKGSPKVGPSADRRRFNGRNFPGAGQSARFAQ